MKRSHFKRMDFIRFFSFLIIFLSLNSFTFDAEGSSPLQGRDLSNVRSEDISDSQLRDYIERGRDEGMRAPEVIQNARQRGLPASEADKLIRRVRELEMEERRRELEERDPDEDPDIERMPDTLVDPEDELDEVGERIFGAQLFRQEDLTFEPSMHVPTPKGYILGPGDEIVVDIWGEATNVHRLEVSKEGTVLIENLGPVYVHGLSIEDASDRIIDELKRVYRGLRPGSPDQTTFARVHLSDLRSIQVTIMGEVHAPGNYTLSSLATVFNALYNARGPNNIGSFRSVKVIRGNEVAAELDIYDLLVHGDQSDNIRLHDQDIIKIDPYETRVDVRGEVKREGYFEMKETETMEDLLKFTGGFTDSAYTEKLRIYRYTTIERKIKTIEKEEFSSFNFRTGDVVFVDEVLDRFENRVNISGAVWYPGEFELKEDMTLYDLIEKANGLRPDAYRERAIINRLKDDFDFELVSVDLNRLLENPEEYDIKLKPEDEVIIKDIFEMREEFNVHIGGAVNETGDYSYREGMTLEDLILKADGFRESATEGRIEVFRRNIDEETTGIRSANLSETFRFAVARNLSLREEDKQFELKPFDQVFVRRKPNYEVQRNVDIEGEVMYPGTYALASRNERISDLIERSGGLTSEAYLPGASLLRERDVQQRDTVELEFGFDEVVEREDTEEIHVGIDLANIMENPGSSEDLFLREGDELRIPVELQTVKVSGAVLRDVELRHQEGRGVNYYVNRAGGYAEDAFKRRAYIVYANGSVEARRSFLFFNIDPDIKPGAEIIIPEKAERDPMDTREFISLMSSIASTAAVIVSILN